MKTIVAIWGAASCGKTETARACANQFTNLYPSFRPIVPIPFVIPARGDFRAVMEIYPGKIVAIESQGDPNTNLDGRLDNIIQNYNPDVLICCSRTRGQTVHIINNIAHRHGYQIIWTSTYDVPLQAQRAAANTLKGQHIVAMLQGLNLI